MYDDQVRARIDKIVAAGTPPNTKAIYKNDLRYFWGWAKTAAFCDESYPVPVELVERFVVDHIEGLPPEIDQTMVSIGIKARLGPHKVSTVYRRLKSLSWMHKHRGLETPTAATSIKRVIAAAKRSESQKGIVARRSKAITRPLLEKMVQKINVRKLIGKRDRAILEFGFYTGGRRRSEIAKAEMRFLSKAGGGYIYLLHRSKTDQTGRGAQKILRTKRAKSLKVWLEATGLTDGFIFRSFNAHGEMTAERINGNTVNAIVKRYIEAIGEDPRQFSAHGLRRGFMTECGRQGNISLGDAMALGGWTDVRTAMTYYEQGRVDQNPAAFL